MTSVRDLDRTSLVYGVRLTRTSTHHSPVRTACPVTRHGKAGKGEGQRATSNTDKQRLYASSTYIEPLDFTCKYSPQTAVTLLLPRLGLLFHKLGNFPAGRRVLE